MKAVSVAIFIGALAGIAAASCVADFGNATFDLSALKRDGTPYSVRDADQDVLYQNFTYIFNVCGDTASIPAYPACNETWSDDHRSSLTGNAPAWQVFPKMGFCHRLGSSASASEWGLYDPKNPARGVTLTYLNGDGCAKHSRSLKLWVECADDFQNIPDEEVVEETDTCFYEIYLRSAFGCPTECGFGGRHVCSAHGFCDFDTSLRKPRCFCNNGWEGDDCGTQTAGPASGLSGSALVLIFVCVLLALLSGLLVFLWTRIRGLRLDPTAYSFLQEDGENGL